MRTILFFSVISAAQCLSVSTPAEISSRRQFHSASAAYLEQGTETNVAMKFVVNNFKHRKDLHWIRDSGVEVEEVGSGDEGDPEYGRGCSEATPWLLWISRNYDNLPEYVGFLHGHQKAWHAHHNATKLMKAKPDTVVMLSEGSCRKFSRLGSKSLMNPIMKEVWGHSLHDGYIKFKMEKNRCCGENIVSKKAIQRHPKRLYELMVKQQVEHRGNWGWAMEYLWQPLFEYDSQPLDKVEQAFTVQTGEIEKIIRKMVQLDSSLSGSAQSGIFTACPHESQTEVDALGRPAILADPHLNDDDAQLYPKAHELLVKGNKSTI